MDLSSSVLTLERRGGGRSNERKGGWEKQNEGGGGEGRKESIPLTDTEDVKVESLVDALVHQLVWEAVKPHMTRQTKFTPLLTLA